ncbi:hypothetical protein B0H65DRAFT_446931 [Neurospora tetraspora]|uniref:Uncharacterized protein n=1 Tax=Neurospora tetraspora TaxID=94610 RepID=A0AAE0MJ92_9PEZI|nr:hypothetical protein B0H65DRAFT_446931 [Neurospora tetraspora]
MSSSSASSKSTNSSVSNTDPANTSPDDREESSNESDDEGNSVVKSPGEKAAIDDIWFQVLWILKLGSDDIEYLQAEVGKLLGTSPHWHETVFSIPTKGKEGRRMISLRKCKARLRNHVAVYNMVAAAEALRNADDDTLQCLFENRLEPLEWVREWLELSDLVFRRIVDADSQKRGVGKEEDTRQIFKKIFDEKKVFRTPKEPSYSGIDEYKHRSQGHKITKNKKKVIDEWRYPGWLKGKWPPHRLILRFYTGSHLITMNALYLE